MAKKKLIATGLTIEKAIQKGLQKIGLPQSQAIIHILQGEESGLFKKTDAAISIIYDEDESHQALIEQVKDELLNWNGTGLSILEIGHRTDEFREIAKVAIKSLRDLLGLDDEHEILFLQGGARLQFAMVPLNLMKNNRPCAYLVTGHWSKVAALEAEKFSQVKRVDSLGNSNRIISRFPKETAGHKINLWNGECCSSY